MVEVANKDGIKKPWFRTWWGIIVLIILWPFSLSYWIWKRKWSLAVRLVLLAFIWIFVLTIYYSSEEGNKTPQSSTAFKVATPAAQVSVPTAPNKSSTNIQNAKQEVDKKSVSAPATASEPTPTPSPAPAPTPYEVLSAIGKDVAGVNSNVSVFKNKDGSVDVINNIQLTPEITLGSDYYTRKWVTGFLSKSFTSGLKIRYVLVTVVFLHTDIPATRVGLGNDLAKIYSEEDWKNFTPYDLCSWLKRIQVGDDTNPGDSSYDPSGWAFAKNYKCN